MKTIHKFLITTIFFVLSISGYSQVWFEAFAVHSNPSKDIFTKGSIIVEQEAARQSVNSTTIKNKDLFVTLADPALGIGTNLRYANSNLVVGLELSYIEYGKPTNFIEIQTFRIGPTIEYYFNVEKKLLPYLGGEFGLQQARVEFNRDIVNQPRISDTNFTIGPRAGLVCVFNNKWSIRLGTKYVFTKNLPFYDFTLGLAYNLGDF